MKNKKLIIIMSMIFFLSFVSVSATEIVDGFEDGDYTSGVFSWTQHAGNIQVGSTQVYSGTYSLEATGSATRQFYMRDLNNIGDKKITIWVYVSEDTQDTYFMIRNTNVSDGNYLAFLAYGVPNDNDIGYTINDVDWTDTGTNYIKNQWNNLTYIYNSTENKITDAWHNGNSLNIGIGSQTINNFYGLYFYDTKDTNSYFDNITIEDYAGGGSPVASLTLNTDMNNTINYNEKELEVHYNGTISNTNNLFNVSVYVDEILNRSFSNVDLSSTQIFNISFGDVEKEFNISINASNNNASDDTGVFYYRVDTIPPILDIGSSFTNNSNLTQLNTLAFYSNYTDPNLFAYNITWFDDTGAVWNNNNYFGTNITTGFAENTTSLLLTDLGNFSIRLQAWDSHTDNEVKPLHWYWDEDNIVISEDLVLEGNIKRFNNKGNLVTYFYLDEQRKDRYKLKVTFKEDSLRHEFNLTSEYLIPVSDSKYLGHFVYRYDRWIDFEGKNIDDVIIKKIGTNKYKIIIYHNTSTDEIEFESIGKLNYNEQVYYYEVKSVTSLSNELLDDIKSELQTLNKGINMIWFWGGYFFSIGLVGFAESQFKSKADDERKKYIYMLSLLVISILFYINSFLNYFSLSNAFKNTMAILLLGTFIVMVLGLDFD